MPTRFTELGLAGKPPGSTDSDQRSALSTSDPFLKQYVINLPVVASAAEQTISSGAGATADLPAHAVVLSGYLRVITAEVTGGTPTLNIGTLAGAGTELGSALAAGSIADVPFENTVPIAISGDSLTYTLGSADWVEFVGELVLLVMGSD